MNTPVGVAVGATSQLRELLAELRGMLMLDEVSEEQVLNCLDILDETSSLSLSNMQRASDMVKSFKRTAVDQSSEAEREYDLAEVIEDVHKSLRNSFKRTSVDVRIDCPPGLRHFGQAGAVLQVLTNLMQNSLIHGFVEGQQAGTITIAASIHSGKVHIDYRDDGVGMPAESLQKVFEPFYTTRRGKGGSGLGMYIAYHLVTDALHGNIHCESSPGNGTQFLIEYPHQSAQHLRTEKAGKS
jgi:signal transduction histidine kinase